MFLVNLNPIAFSIGSIDIRWYSLSYIFGILISWFIINNYLLKYKKNINKVLINNALNYWIIGIILGGRIGYVLFYNPGFYFNNPIEIIKIWNGGMSFHGGLIGLIFTTYILSNKQTVNFFDFSDLLALVAPIGIFFGRMANFVNGELLGRVTDSFLGVKFSNISDQYRHPSQLYEALFEGIVLYIILNYIFIYTKYQKIAGFVSGLFLFLYGFFRFFIEFFREPDPQIGYIFIYFTMGQILCFIMMVMGFFITSYSLKKNK